MNARDKVEFSGVWAGLSTILVSVLALGVFVFTSDPINTGGVVTSGALAAVGIAEFLAPGCYRGLLVFLLTGLVSSGYSLVSVLPCSVSSPQLVSANLVVV